MVREWLPVQTEPQTVERAPRRERWKRQAWLIGSTILAFTAVAVVAGVAMDLAGVERLPEGVAGLPYSAGLFAVAIIVDLRLFAWGVDRFDLVVPWQFREAEVADDG